MRLNVGQQKTYHTLVTRTWNRETEKPIYVAYGIGRNSTAQLVEMRNRGIIPSDIVTADTGGEKPETYEYLEMFSEWLVSQGFPRIVVVKREPTEKASYSSLEEECLVGGTLPSIVFGFKSCSEKWKIRPQHKYARDKYGDLSSLRWAIGYHAGEQRRANNAGKTKHSYELWYPLIEWGIDGKGCERIILEAGLPLPPKSACFFCPSSRLSEIADLKNNHPELWKRIVAMEDGATPNMTSVKGLGRKFRWQDLDILPQEKKATFADTPAIPCGCFDDDSEDEE